MAETRFTRAPGLLGPIFEEAGNGERSMREALFLTFNVDAGFFETQLLGSVRSTGAAVTVVADAGVFDPDPRSVRSAGHAYALGVAATAGAFHPKLTMLVGPERALVGIGSGNLTVPGWHGNDEVLTTIRADREQGAPRILHDVVRFLRNLQGRVAISPLAVDGIGRTAEQLDALLATTDPVETGHVLMDSLRGPILEQLPTDPIDALELTAPFHDPRGRALAALIDRYHVHQVTVLAQPGQAVMDPAVLRQVAAVRHCTLSFLQVEGDSERATRYRHGKVVTGLRADRPVWTMAGSANLSAAALLDPPAANVELGVLHRAIASLLPTPTHPVLDVATLHHRLELAEADRDPMISPGVTVLEARAVANGLEVTLSVEADRDLLVEVSAYTASPEDYEHLGWISREQRSAFFPGTFGPGTRVRVAGQLRHLHFPELVIRRLQRTGIGRPNSDVTFGELFTSEVAARRWYDALIQLWLTHGRAGRPGVTAAAAPIAPIADQVTATWRTLDDEDNWAAYTEDSLTRLGLPIFRLAAGTAATPATVGASLSNAAPAWEDRFEETVDSFEEDESAETVEQLDEVVVVQAPLTLSARQCGLVRRRLSEAVGSMPGLGPYERIAIAQWVIVGTSAAVWAGATGSNGWFDTLADALATMDDQTWPTAAAPRAAAVTAIGLRRLRDAVPDDERGNEAHRFLELIAALQPLIDIAEADSITDNLDLLAGTTFVEVTAEDVIELLASFTGEDFQDALGRVWERLLPDFDFDWLDQHRVQFRGRTSSPKNTAGDALRHAEDILSLAVGVHADSGGWAVVGKIPGRLLVMEGGKRPTTYRTYNTTQLLNPLAILTSQDLEQRTRISSVPFIRPGPVDREVLDALGLDAGPMI